MAASMDTGIDSDNKLGVVPFGTDPTRMKFKSLGIKGSAMPPPASSMTKLSPHTTLIDLGWLKQEKGDMPVKVEEVTVMIDDSNVVQVLGYDVPKKSKKSQEGISVTLLPPEGKRGHLRKKSNPLFSEDELEEAREVEGDGEETPPPEEEDNSKQFGFNLFSNPMLTVALEQMRKLQIDCNVSLIVAGQNNIVYAHRTVLIARSSYFYRKLYVKRKGNHFFNQYCRCSLPSKLNSCAVEAVVSFMYTGTLSLLWSKPATEIKNVLELFELHEELKQCQAEWGEGIPEKEELENNVTRHNKTKITEIQGMEGTVVDEPIDALQVDQKEGERESNCLTIFGVKRKRGRRSLADIAADGENKLKTCIQRLTETALTPFVSKIEELFDPSSTTLQIARTSQHVITLWHADILLTKLFGQNELTRHFSHVISNVTELQWTMALCHEWGDFTVEEVKMTPHSKDYNSSQQVILGNSNSTLSDEMEQALPLDPSEMPLYVHAIAVYRYRLRLGRRHGKDLMTPLMEGDDEQALEDLMGTETPVHTHLGMGTSEVYLAQSTFRMVSADLRRRSVMDLEAHVDVSFHEELVMHIVVDQMEQQAGSGGYLPLVVAVFLAKGCGFCRGRECSLQDLTLPVAPGNPVCPNRACIKRNLVCDVCGKQMPSSKSLARHRYAIHDLQVVDNQGLFICSHCGDTFTKKWKLNMHERMHEDLKIEATCEFCSKRIRGVRAMRKHVYSVHEKERIYNCEFCSKAFKRRETLLVHCRIHTGEKPFVCSRCEYASETKGNLKAHMWRKHKVHTGGRLFAHADELVFAPEGEGGEGLTSFAAHKLEDGRFVITSAMSADDDEDLE